MSPTETTAPAKLVRHGSGYAVVIDGDLVRQLGIDESTPLSVTLKGNALVVAQSDPARQKKFEAAVQETFDKYDKMMKRLAE